MPEQKEFYFDGILRSCPRCASKREAMRTLNKDLNGFLLVGTEPDEQHDSDLNRKGVRTYGPWQIECSDCKGTGVKLSNKGMRLLGILKMWIEEASPTWAAITDSQIEQEQEIPF